MPDSPRPPHTAQGVQILSGLESPEASNRDEDSEDEAMTREAKGTPLAKPPAQEESTLASRPHSKSLRATPY